MIRRHIQIAVTPNANLNVNKIRISISDGPADIRALSLGTRVAVAVGARGMGNPQAPAAAASGGVGGVPTRRIQSRKESRSRVVRDDGFLRGFATLLRILDAIRTVARWRARWPSTVSFHINLQLRFRFDSQSIGSFRRR